MAVNRLRLKYQAEAGDKKAEAIKEILYNPDRILGVILFGVTVAEIAAAGIVTYVIASNTTSEHVEIFSLAGSILFSIIILIFCELTPKIVAAAYRNKYPAYFSCLSGLPSGSCFHWRDWRPG